VSPWFQSLVDAGATIDFITPGGQSALFVAAKRGACGAIAALIRMGAAVHAEPAPGKTALFAALENDQVKALEVLVRMAPTMVGRSRLNQ
jgi:hypothetical protein